MCDCICADVCFYIHEQVNWKTVKQGAKGRNTGLFMIRSFILLWGFVLQSILKYYFIINSTYKVDLKVDLQHYETGLD